jgi:hypothetical protein
MPQKPALHPAQLAGLPRPDLPKASQGMRRIVVPINASNVHLLDQQMRRA